MVILCALATEFCSLVSVTPIDVLHGFSSRLSLYSREFLDISRAYWIVTMITATVQEACLISMLRMTADLDDVPTKTIEIVTKLRESAGRHIRRVRHLLYNLCQLNRLSTAV